jgi:hypothetical protein
MLSVYKEQRNMGSINSVCYNEYFIRVLHFIEIQRVHEMAGIGINCNEQELCNYCHHYSSKERNIFHADYNEI